MRGVVGGITTKKTYTNLAWEVCLLSSLSVSMGVHLCKILPNITKNHLAFFIFAISESRVAFSKFKNKYSIVLIADRFFCL